MKELFLVSLYSVVDEPKQKVKRQKGQTSTSGFLAPLQLSDALVKFIGTGEIELSRSDVVKRMWKYIKENELQVCYSTCLILYALIS